MAADSFPAALPPPAKMSTTSQRRCRQLRPFWLAVALSLWTATAAGLLHASESNLDETTWSYEASVGFCLDILTSAGLLVSSSSDRNS